MQLYKPKELAQEILTYPGREALEWWDMLPLPSNQPIPPIDDFLVSLDKVGCKFEEIPWPQAGTQAWQDQVERLKSGLISSGPHFYLPKNILRMPSQHAFWAHRSYYRCALHELSHGTGHASRLDRNPANSLDLPRYAREECIAELSGAILYVELGGEPSELMASWASYVLTWKGRHPALDVEGVIEAARQSAQWLLNEAFE